jgi:hypothetical protein
MIPSACQSPRLGEEELECNCLERRPPEKIMNGLAVTEDEGGASDRRNIESGRLIVLIEKYLCFCASVFCFHFFQNTTMFSTGTLHRDGGWIETTDSISPSIPFPDHVYHIRHVACEIK